MGMTTYYTGEIKRMYEHGAISLSDYYVKAITMSKIEGDNMRDKINILFEEMSGTKRLTMSHDTTGFPSMMTCKKKYAYLKQEENIRMTYVKFMPKLFKVKGLEMVKRGKSAKLVEIGNMILLRSLNFENIIKYLNNLDADGLNIVPIINGVKLLVDDVVSLDGGRIRRLPENSDIYNFLYDIICDELDKLIANSGNNYDAFTKTAVYKPLRNNLTVKAYVNKLKNRGDPIPEAGVRFNYVVVQMKNTIDQRGRNIKYKIGDQWETPEYARDHNLDLDLTYYMNNEVAGTLARFLSYMFMDDDNEDDVAEDESKSYKLAQNMVKKMIKERTLASADNSVIKKQMKRRYDEISKHIDSILNTQYSDIYTMKMIDQIKTALIKTKKFEVITTADPIYVDDSDDDGDTIVDDIDNTIVDDIDTIVDDIDNVVDIDISVDDKTTIKRLQAYITGNVYEADLDNARTILEQYKQYKMTNKLYTTMGPKNPLYNKSIQLFKDTEAMRTRVEEMLLILPTVDQFMADFNIHEFTGYNEVFSRSKHVIIEKYSIIKVFMRDFKQYFGLLASNAEITFIIRNLYIKK
jgi:hypothetical protein